MGAANTKFRRRVKARWLRKRARIIQPFHIDELPEPVLRHLFKFLDWKDQKCLRQLCKGMHHFIDEDYGIHAYLPSRYGYYKRSTSTPGRIPIADAVLITAIGSLEGKVIRSLQIRNWMHPKLNPFPFLRLIQYPWKLLRVSLEYVDADLIIALLTSCRNLTELHYTTATRFLPRGGVVHIPTLNEQLIMEMITRIPQATFQMNKLYTLSLRLERADPKLHSDWANVIFLLLALSQRSLGSLKNFYFDFDGHKPTWNLKDRLQLVACIGQFLGGCPNLRNFEYSSGFWTSRSDHDLIRSGTPLPQTVFSGLIQRYGSDLLKQVSGVEALGYKDRMLKPIRQIMKEAGMSLRNLKDVRMSWGCGYESELFQILLSALPTLSMGNVHVCDQTGKSFTGRNRTPSTPQLYWNLTKLLVHRMLLSSGPIQSLMYADNRRIPLPQILTIMGALTYLEFSPENLPTTKLYLDYHSYARRGNDLDQLPNFTFDQLADVRFEQLQVLKLEGAEMTTEAAARLIELRSLKELTLEVIPEQRDQPLGIKSEDLIRLMGTLRKLDKVFVNMIQFPEDDKLKSKQCAALGEIGKVKQMIRQARRHFGNAYYSYDTEELMEQYKFIFGFDEVEDVHRWGCQWDVENDIYL